MNSGVFKHACFFSDAKFQLPSNFSAITCEGIKVQPLNASGCHKPSPDIVQLPVDFGTIVHISPIFHSGKFYGFSCMLGLELHQ